MSKNKKTVSRKDIDMQIAAAIALPFNLSDIDVEKYLPTLAEVLANKDFNALNDKRTRLLKVAYGMRRDSAEGTNAVKQIASIDVGMAEMIFRSLIMKNQSEHTVNEVVPFNQLLRYYVDYSQEGMKERVEKLANNLDKMTFLADVLESALTDIKADMEHIFKGEVQFKQFDVVANTMKQMSQFFGSVLGSDPDSPAGQLYMEYSDSINAYVDKRMNTYNEKHRKISPIHDVYGADDMVKAINQFFGTDKKFGHQFIKRSLAGGRYIDAMKLISNLNSLETEKLERG